MSWYLWRLRLRAPDKLFRLGASPEGGRRAGFWAQKGVSQSLRLRFDTKTFVEVQTEQHCDEGQPDFQRQVLAVLQVIDFVIPPFVRNFLVRLPVPDIEIFNPEPGRW